MKNIKILENESLKSNSDYKSKESGIYERIDNKGVPALMSVEMELEEGEDSQYPLEDILDKYLIHVEEFLSSSSKNKLNYVLGGDVAGLQKFKSLVGKRVYNQEYKDESGKTRVKLMIE